MPGKFTEGSETIELPTDFDAVEIYDRFLNGEPVEEIAKSLNLHRAAVESIIRLALKLATKENE